MLLLLLPTIFRGKIDFPDEIVVYVNSLNAVTAGLVRFIDNDLVHKLMQELGGQFRRLSVFFHDFQKTVDCFNSACSAS